MHPARIRHKPYSNAELSLLYRQAAAAGRLACPTCGKARKHYCYTCHILLGDKEGIPVVSLPFLVDMYVVH